MLNVVIQFATKKWWAHQDLNLGPTGYEPVALTNWAIGPWLLIENLARHKQCETRKHSMERKTRLELATPTLARWCSTNWAISAFYGAENETRNRDPHLGKVMLYQLSYFRMLWLFISALCATDRCYCTYFPISCQHFFEKFITKNLFPIF